MNERWGVYNLQGLDAEGGVVEANAKSARKSFIRWRVGDNLHKRTFKAKMHARGFRERLIRAQVMGWPADARGWPVAPETESGARPALELAEEVPSLTVRQYCEHVWWPIVSPDYDDKNRLGHRTNMRLALDLLVYREGDPRLYGRSGQVLGGSILLGELVADDLRRAVVERRSINLRTRAVNARRLDAAQSCGALDVVLEPEEASAATVHAFYVTMQLFVKSAMNSGHTVADPLAGVAGLAPPASISSMTARFVPSVDEVFDLAEAIASLGPLKDRRPLGERFRSLVLVAGTLGPRPGELVAHRPEWIAWGEPTCLRFEQTEASVYDAESGIRGARTRPLKHREEGDFRVVPALDAVADALREHVERGYSGHDRTWTSPTGRGRLNWGNMKEDYWRPACEQVFGGTEKSHLVQMSPKTLRKAAVTLWLDSGISPFLAAEWAGHSAEVAQRYYAGRSSMTYGAEIEKMGRFTQR